MTKNVARDPSFLQGKICADIHGGSLEMGHQMRVGWLKMAIFGQSILMKIIKIVATRCHNFKAKMHQIRFRLGLRPRPRWGAYSAPPDPLAGFQRAYF